METIFNFSNEDTEFIYALHPKSEIILHIKRKSKSVACLYFTNQLNNRIGIPSEFIVYQNNNIIKPDNENSEGYTLYWSKNYDIVYRGDTLYNIRPERSWTIYN
jgi:hypothetical protein